MKFSLTSILETVTSALTVLATMISAAEDLFAGGQKGAEKKKWVIEQATPLLVKHVGPFWSTGLGQAVLGIMIDTVVTLVNAQGKA